MKFPRLPRFPVLTKAEKSALIVLTLILSSGAALRAWEHSGVRLGPVKDWDSLRSLVLQARLAAGGDTVFPCLDAQPSFSGEHWPERKQDSASARSEKKPASRSNKKVRPSAPLDLNKAALAALQSLPGVGPSTAKAILAERKERGGFHAVEDLLEVKGIGPKKFAAMREFLRVGAARKTRARDSAETAEP